MLPDFASEKTKQGPLDKLFLLTLARRVLPHYLSALVGNGLPLLLLLRPEATRNQLNRPEGRGEGVVNLFSSLRLATLELSSNGLERNALWADPLL